MINTDFISKIAADYLDDNEIPIANFANTGAFCKTRHVVDLFRS